MMHKLHVIMNLAVACVPTSATRASTDLSQREPGTYELLPTNLTKVKTFAKQNVGPVCDALLNKYHDTVLSGPEGASNFKLVQNCEDLLYHAAEAQEAPVWQEEGISVISGHYDQVASKLLKKVRMPTIAFSCYLLQKLQDAQKLPQSSYRWAMGNVTASEVPIFLFDTLMWWRPGPLFTFKPPFEVIKFPRDPTVKVASTKTKDDVGGQERLDKLAIAQKSKPGTKIEYASDRNTISSVTIEKPENLGQWRKDCKKFYQEAETSPTNPFQCAKVATPSFQLASLAAALKAKIDDGSVTSGLWLVDGSGEDGRFTLQPKGSLTTNPVEIEVTRA